MTMDRTAEIAAVCDWWCELNGASGKKKNTAALAMLRRASDPLDALALPATADLCRRLGVTSKDPAWRLLRVAVLAHALACVREGRTPDMGPGWDRHAFTRTLGGRREGGDADSHLYSPLRFERLVRAEDPADLMIQLRRAIAVADAAKRVIDVGSLAAFVLGGRDRRERTAAILAYHEGARASSDQTEAA